MGLDNGIGADNQLLWHLPKDLKYFKETTTDHPIIMGRKTYESIGKPLPNRTNIVVSKRKDWFEEGILIVGSVKEALKFAKKMNENIFVIGGGNIYEQTIDLADKLQVTLVKTQSKAEVFFPKINLKVWDKTAEICHEKDDKNEYDFCFQIYLIKESI